MGWAAIFRETLGATALPPDLDARLAQLTTTALAAWPALGISADEFVAYLAARLPKVDVAAALDKLCPADLYLACGCARGLPAALALFEAHVLADVPRQVHGIDASPAFAAELMQQLRVTLLVAPANGKPPRIAQYAGACPLSGWLRVVAVRAALLEKKRADPLSAPDGLEELVRPAAAAAAADHELVRLRYQPEFQAALEAALAALGAKERNLLRLHYIERLSIDRLSPMFGVHRATCARWIRTVHDQLLASVHARLQEELGLSADELESLAGLMVSGLHISMARALVDATSAVDSSLPSLSSSGDDG